MKKDEYLSLYEYLGRAAGPLLGSEVKKYADMQGIPFELKRVANPNYTGNVIVYPKPFLELYFRTPSEMEKLTEIKD